MYNHLAPGADQRSCALHGTGGVGKTQLAQEFCYRYANDFPYVFWLRAEDKPNLIESFGKVSQFLNLNLSGSTSSEAKIEVVRCWLCKSKSTRQTDKMAIRN
jgi:GTPase SAR1 family protein